MSNSSSVISIRFAFNGTGFFWYRVPGLDQGKSKFKRRKDFKDKRQKSQVE